MRKIKDYHSLDASTFQNLIADLFNARENTKTYSIWGKNGQKQNGIDVFSGEKRTAIQCKYTDDTMIKSRGKLMAKVERDVKKAAASGIKFDYFIIASTYKHDVVMQHFSLKLRDDNNYPFEIIYYGWDELRKWILQFPAVLNLYFSNPLKPEIVELVSINIDSKACSWDLIDGYENVFFDKESKKSPYPVFDFTFVNHYNKTIVMKSIRLTVKRLYSGLSGLPSPPVKVKVIHKYLMKFEYGKENILRTIPPIQIGADQAFRFKLELRNEYNGEPYQIEGRNILFFSFDFNSDIRVVAPKVYLNTKNDSNKITIMYSE